MNSKIYIMVTLIISWVLTIVFYFSGVLYSFVPIIMLLPAICAFLMRILKEDTRKEIFANPNKKGMFELLKSLVFALMFPIIIILLCSITGAIIYKETLNLEFFSVIFSYSNFVKFIPVSFLSFSIIFSFGEEYGWRGYLLPELLKSYPKIKSIVILGIVWALYHFPVMILLNIDTLGLMKTVRISIIQAIAAFVFSFAFAKCYLISNRLYPVVVMHTFWNMFNPQILGSVYDGTHGVILKTASIEIINGEGVLGSLFAAVFAIYIIYSYLLKEKRHGNYRV